MSSGDPCYDDIPPKGSLGRFLELLMEYPDLKAAIAVKRSWNGDYEVPYLAGSSLDGQTLYFDPKLHSLPDWAKRLIALHEIVEWSLKPYEATYEERHHMATAAEDRYVYDLGHTPSEYRALLRPFYAPIEHEKLTNCPPDLDLSPYSGELLRTLEDMQNGKVSKISVMYGHGARHRNCGLCQMFRSPDACTLVAGPISPDAVCDRFVRRLQ
jgi:hypothetical protein